MTSEWIKFGFVALFFLLGIITLFISVFGLFKFKFALNRIHAAAMADTLALLIFIIGIIIVSSSAMIGLKLLLVIFIQWCTSPISSHMLTQFEYLTDKNLSRYCELDESLGEEKND